MNTDKFVDQLRELVGIHSLPGNVAENAKIMDLVETWVDKRAKRMRLRNGKAEILLLSNNELIKPEIAYMVHCDVVAGRDDQFEMKVEGDRLVGRGVSDMKFSIPIGLSVLNEAIQVGLKKSFCLVITTDEEVGGIEGAKHLAEVVKFEPKMLIVPDGGDNWVFVNKAKGICQVLVESTGRPAHASRVWLGKNALEPLTIFASKLVRKFAKNNAKESWLTTMNIGQIQGGVSTNQVCDQATMKLDFRFPETTDENKLLAMVSNLANRVDSGLKVSKIASGSPTITDVSNVLVQRFIGCMQKVADRQIVIKPTYGGSDARWFAHLAVPVMMLKPVGGEIHSENEWICLSSCMAFADGVRDFVINS